MKKSKLNPPLDRTDLIDLYFLEHRARLIDIAAFLDRLDRASDAGNTEDFRIKAFNKATAILLDRDADKARRILEVFSDHSSDIPDSAPRSKGASGAPPEKSK